MLDYKTLAQTIKNVIINPKEEWLQIKAAPLSNKEIVLTVVLPLTLAAAIISLLVIWLGTYLTFGFALKVAIRKLLLPIVTIVAVAILANELAGTFNSAKNLTASLKLISYSATPWLLAKIIASLIAALSWITIFGLYGIYLIYIGLPLLMDTPKDKNPVYTLTIVVLIFAIQLILTSIFSINRVNL